METMENHGMDAEFNFESALEDYLSTDFGDLEEGTIVKGEIVRVDDDNVPPPNSGMPKAISL